MQKTKFTINIFISFCTILFFANSAIAQKQPSGTSPNPQDYMNQIYGNDSIPPELQEYFNQLYGGTNQNDNSAPDFVELEKTSFSSEDILLQGYFLLELGDYLGGVGKKMGNNSISEVFIENATEISTNGETLIDSEEILSSGESIVMIADSLEIFGKTLFLTKTSKSIPEEMSYIGQSISKSAEGLKKIGEKAVIAGGSFDITEYKQAVDYVKFFYRAFLALRETMNTGLGPKAKLKSNQALENSNTTFQVINFDASGSRDDSGTIPSESGYLWDFGDGSFGSGPYISHTFNEANTYLVKLFVVGPSGFAYASTEIQVDPVYPVAIINTNLEAPIGPNPTNLSIYSNQLIRLSAANSYDPGGNTDNLKFSWDFGDGQRSSSSGLSVEHNYKRPGTYLLTLEVANNNLTDITSKTIEVLPPPPKASFAVRTEGERKWQLENKQFFSELLTNSLVMEFDASSSMGAALPGVETYSKLKNFAWDFGDGAKENQDIASINAGDLVSHTYAKPGIYIASLTVTDESGNSNTVSKNIYLGDIETPVADFSFTNSSEYTTQDVMRFDASASRVPQGSIQEYIWEIRKSNGEIESQESEKKITHIFKEAGEYLVSLEIKSNLGTVSPKVNQEILIESSSPMASFSFVHDSQIPNQIYFDASLSSDPDLADILSYSWDFNNDGEFEVVDSTKTEITRVLDKIGNNEVTLMVTDSFGKSNSVTKSVEIDSILVANLKARSDKGSVGTAPFEAKLEARGFYNLSSGTDVNNIKSITWDFGDGSPQERTTNLDKGRSIKSHIYTIPGTYEVKISVTDIRNNQSENYMPIYVGVLGKPIAAFTYSPDSSVTANTDTTFVFDASLSRSAKNDSDQLEYSWDFGDGSPLENNVIVEHKYRKHGTYKLTLTVTDLYAEEVVRSSYSISIFDKDPVAIFSVAPSQGEASLITYFDASASHDPDGEIVEYLWNFGDGKRSITKKAKINHIYKDPGTYHSYLMVTSNNGVKIKSESTIIEVY